jgi:hypothetical protein
MVALNSTFIVLGLLVEVDVEVKVTVVGAVTVFIDSETPAIGKTTYARNIMIKIKAINSMISDFEGIKLLLPEKNISFLAKQLKY